MLKQSLAIEEKLSPPSDERIGRRLVEQAVNFAAQVRWDEGVQCLDRVIPLGNQFSGQERTFLSLVLSEYGNEFRRKNRIDLAERYESASIKLK